MMEERTMPMNYYEQRKVLKKKYFNLPQIPQNLKNQVESDTHFTNHQNFEWMPVYEWLHFNNYSDLKDHVITTQNRKGEIVLTWKKIPRVKYNERSIPTTVKGLFYPQFAHFSVAQEDRIYDLINLVEKYTGYSDVRIRVLGNGVPFIIWDPRQPLLYKKSTKLCELLGSFQRLDLFIDLIY